MNIEISVKKVKEICEKKLEGRVLTWEEAVAIKCETMFDMYKTIMLRKWKMTNTR